MSATDVSHLELLSLTGNTACHKSVPLLFIHGAYTAAWCWQEYFLPYFSQQGYDCHAVSLSGHGGSQTDRAIDQLSISDYVEDVIQVINTLPCAPVLIGHSMGGMVVQKYLEQHDSVPAVALLCSVPPQGLLGSALGLLFNNPNILSDLNRAMKGLHPDPENIRKALFHQAMDAATLIRYANKAQPESQRAIWDMTLFNLPQLSAINARPMLVMGAEYDRIIPPNQVKLTASAYGVEAHIMKNMGHGLMLEAGWHAAAEVLLDWLNKTLRH